MTEQPTPTPQPTADQLLNMVIQTLFDIPENSQIQVPVESIVKRINALKNGFVHPDAQKQISDELGAFRRIVSKVFGSCPPVPEVVCNYLSATPKWGGPLQKEDFGDLPDPEQNEEDCGDFGINSPI